MAFRDSGPTGFAGLSPDLRRTTPPDPRRERVREGGGQPPGDRGPRVAAGAGGVRAPPRSPPTGFRSRLGRRLVHSLPGFAQHRVPGLATGRESRALSVRGEEVLRAVPRSEGAWSSLIPPRSDPLAVAPGDADVRLARPRLRPLRSLQRDWWGRNHSPQGGWEGCPREVPHHPPPCRSREPNSPRHAGRRSRVDRDGAGHVGEPRLPGCGLLARQGGRRIHFQSPVGPHLGQVGRGARALRLVREGGPAADGDLAAVFGRRSPARRGGPRSRDGEWSRRPGHSPVRSQAPSR
jgi:hypothetical protein